MFVDYTVSDRVATIMLNRPNRMNALGRDLVAGLKAAYQTFADDQDADVAIIHGQGRAFCAGADMKDTPVSEDAVDDGPTPFLDSDKWKWRFEAQETDKPIIAAVHGWAVGGGAAITIGCDYKIAGEDAVFSFPEISAGIRGPWELSTYHVIPWAVASEIALLGRRIPSATMYKFGLLNEVVAAGQHLNRAREVAQEFLAQPQDVLRATKALLVAARQQVPDEAIRQDVQALVRGRELRASSPTAAKFTKDE